MSQIKVWRIIERRREEKATEHLREQQLKSKLKMILAGELRKAMHEIYTDGKPHTMEPMARVDILIQESVLKRKVSAKHR